MSGRHCEPFAEGLKGTGVETCEGVVLRLCLGALKGRPYKPDLRC